ncbi:hypothetical protein EBT31_14540, partial [bacterium]|nr:hypothetical protein [bacterium]
MPNPDDVHLRIVKSPQTIANLRSIAKGLEVIPGIPYSISDLVASSHGVLNIDFSPDGSITMILDHALSDAEQATFAAFGASVSVNRQETIVSSASAAQIPSHNIASGIFTTLWQGSAARMSV